MEQDTILMQLLNKTVSDFENVIYFANSLKWDLMQLKKIGIKNVPDWLFTI